MATLSLQLGHNATVGLLKDNKIVGVLSQEKMDNIKNSSAFPGAAILSLCKFCDVKLSEIDSVVVCGNYIIPKFLSDDPYSFKASGKPSLIGKLAREVKYKIVKSGLKNLFYRYKTSTQKNAHQISDLLRKRLEELSIKVKNIYFVDHHTCHAFSAAYFFQPDGLNRLIFTLDGEGDNLSSTLWLKDAAGDMKRVACTYVDDSIGHIYVGVTKFLGMTPLEHEYKVMGLSAYTKEKYSNEAYDRLFAGKINVVPAGDYFNIAATYDTTSTEQLLKREAYGLRFDNVAGAVQKLTEEVVVEWIEKNVEKTDIRQVAVSGGVFMNVKLNMKLQSSRKIENIQFLPSCGDESNVIGALYYFRKKIEPAKIDALDEMYLGIGFTDEEVASYLQNNAVEAKYTVVKSDDINECIAALLADGKIVARATGRNEWGARSLGNRAILGHPSYMQSFYTVNDQIKARDFWMPFAPSILDTDGDDYLIGYDEARSYPYAMITAYDTSALGVEKIRAGIHQGDHTCRPQIVTVDRNADYHDLISKFKQKTGVGAVLNTSLNIHGYPLAATLEQVLFTFEHSGLEHVAINDYLISKR